MEKTLIVNGRLITPYRIIEACSINGGHDFMDGTVDAFLDCRA